MSTSPSSLLGGRLAPERDASSECGPQGEDLVGKERHFSLQICSVPRERPGLPFLQDFAQSWSGKCSSSATTQASFSQDGLYPEDSGLRQSVREGWREEPGRGPGRPELPAGSSAGSHGKEWMLTALFSCPLPCLASVCAAPPLGRLPRPLAGTHGPAQLGGLFLGVRLSVSP